jgi:hypothetical protein
MPDLARAFRTVCDRQQRIRAIIADGRQVLAQQEASMWKAVALARWHMLRALADLNAIKNDEILRPLIDAWRQPLADRALTVFNRNAQLAQDYDAFVARWAISSPISISRDYMSEALAMAKRIEHEMALDEQEIPALIEAARTARKHDGAPASKPTTH